MEKGLNVKVTVRTVPHPNPRAAIELIAGIVVKQLLEETNNKCKPQA